MSWSLQTISTCHTGRVRGNLLLQPFTNKLALEAQLPNDKQHVVQQLQSNTTSKTTISAAHAVAAIERRVCILGGSCGGAENVEERVQRLLPLFPKCVARLAAAQDSRVEPHGNILEGGVR
jgi:hypothetical protein